MAGDNVRQFNRMPAASGDLDNGGGGPHDPNMEQRVTRLETHFEYIRKDLDGIKLTTEAISQRLATMPTNADLWSWKLQWSAIAIGAVALIVGGIIGGLAWIKPESAPAPQPIVIQVPATLPTPAGTAGPQK